MTVERDDVTPATWVVAAGRPAGIGEPTTTPLTLTSTFRHGADASYTRNEGSPTWEALEELVGGLEHGDATAFSSGMAAAAAVLDLFPAGSHIAIPDDCYQGVAALVDDGVAAGRWTVRRVATADVAGWAEALLTADLVWIESPSNPMLVVADLPAICELPRREGCVVAVDNTFATPLNQRPLVAGADLVMHSATKYIGGHSDLLAGVVVARPDTDLHAQIRRRRALGGATPGAMEAHLATRGARTLALRLSAAQTSAIELAARMEGHPEISSVLHPSLISHPDHDVAARVLDGPGAIITFVVTGGAERAEALCAGVRLIQHTTSLGGVESNMERRSRHGGQEHLPPGLIRLSVGIEDVEDLWNDLSVTLDATRAHTG